MIRTRLVPILSLALAAILSASAHAATQLIAVGTISGAYQDLSSETAAPLENGVAGNRLGGMGSGLAYAGDDTFIAVPDRGPNAVSYDNLIDDTVSYINRFETFRLALAPSDPGSALPFVLTPTLRNTTLLYSHTPLVYGSGAGLGVGNGAPALNSVNHVYYFTGRSDNFDPDHPSSNPADARFDPESVRVSNDGRDVFISDEYGPYLYEFDRVTGRRKRVFQLPANLYVTTLSPQGSVETDDNTSGRVANKGMEGLAITPDGKMLVGIMQKALIQDGGKKGKYSRIVTVDIRTGETHEYAYPHDNIGTDSKPKYTSLSDIVAVNDHEFLVDERDGEGLGKGTAAVEKKLYLIDLTGATDVTDISGEANLAPYAVAKTQFLDLVSLLNANGISSGDIPSKLEGIAFGPDVTVNGESEHTLFIANDNDFLPTTTDLNGQVVDNPSHWYVVAFDDSDLPGYVPQPVRPLDGDYCGHGGDGHRHHHRH